MLARKISVVVELNENVPCVSFSVFDGLEEKVAFSFTNSDLFHERVEEAVMNLLRPITNSAAAELRKLRRKAQAQL